MTGGILAGLVLTIAAGALDCLGYLDLRVLRATDPFTNLTGADRLQSTFGHAGWFAEYLCFATPADPGAVAVAGRRRRRATRSREPRGRQIVRVAAAAGLLVIALVAIVLSYQRGGWITWALVAAGVVAAIVWLVAAATGTAAAALPLRRLVAIGAAAVILAIAAGLVVVRVAGGPGAMDRFAARARTITQVSDRQAHVTAGLRLGALCRSWAAAASRSRCATSSSTCAPAARSTRAATRRCSTCTAAPTTCSRRPSPARARSG